MNKDGKPIEVWLTQRNMEVTCRIVHEDETVETVDVDSLSMRGAQREITGWLIGDGFKAIGRWTVEHSDINGPAETVRRFAPADGAPEVTS
jgi:hypothetical protein